MTAKMYYDADADPSALAGQKIAIIGYGSQGHAHAQNLKDSGYDVTVVEANPKARAIAEESGLKTADIADAVKAADVIMILVPDTIQKKVYEESILPNMHKGQLLMFAHGFNIRFDRIKPGPGIDVGMVAPKGPGHLVRSVFEQGGGVPALFAVEKDDTGTARARVLAYARGIGATRAGVLETTFKEETETDLFGEQVVLCGGVTELIRNGFETLVEAGYQPELAYFEVMHELKLIVDLIYRGGMNFMRFSVSDTAEYGDYVSGPRIIDSHVRDTMKQVLTEIQDGSFAAAWIAENEAGQPNFKKMRERGRDHQIEKVGASLRKAMPFLNPVEVVDGQPQAAAKNKG
jgi:ketol-acid reductoisomerase